MTAQALGEEIEIEGSPIRYGIALLERSAPQARGFVRFLLSPESQSIYREMGYGAIPVRQLILE